MADVFTLFNRKATDIADYPSQLRSEAVRGNDIAFHPVELQALRVTLVHNF